MIENLDQTIESMAIPERIDVGHVGRASLKDSFETFFSIPMFIGVIIGAIAGLASGDNIFDKAWGLVSDGFSGGVIGAVAGVIVSLIAYASNKTAQKSGEKRALQEYKIAKAQDNKRVVAEREQANKLALVKNTVIERKRKTHELLEHYYSKDILYPTYHNMAAVCSICGYLKSGRCVQLQGHEGAYNLYENERRLDRIVERLDEVVVRLDEIKNNQFMLYSAIQQGNQTVNQILTETYRQSQLQEFSAQQNAITAYNSSIIANEVSMSNWLKAYELSNQGM